MIANEEMIKDRITSIDKVLSERLHSLTYERREMLFKERQQLKKALLQRRIETRRPIGMPVSSMDIASHIIKDNHMFVEFENESNQLVFRMVKDGQMFIDKDGNLCQKSTDDENEGWCIANSDGEPSGAMSHYEDNEAIRKILPNIKKISF